MEGITNKSNNRNLLWSHIDSVVEQLRKAFEEKECENVAQLLPELGNPYCRWRCQYLLHFGARNGWLHVCRELVFRFGYSPIEPTKHGISPVHVAAAYGSLDILHFLLSECREDCENRDAAGRTPLHYASMGGKVEVVKYLITVMHCNPNVCARRGSTPLHIACSEGHLSVVKCLIENFNCSPLMQNKCSFTALNYAAGFGYCDVLCYLIKYCSNIINPLLCLDDCDNTLLHYACGGKMLMANLRTDEVIIFNDLEALLYLNSVKKRNAMMTDTMNHEALCEVVKYLVTILHLDPNALNSREESPLFIACNSGCLQIVKFLVSLGCSLHCQDRYRNTVLHNACRSGNLDLVCYLAREYKVDFNVKNSKGNTALDVAARGCGDSQKAAAIVKFFIIKMKCDLSLCWRKKTNKFTPSFCSNALHWACRYGDTELVSYLINQCGINASCRLKQGESPLHVACMAGNIDIVKLLINQFGCCSTVTDRKGTNLLHVAVRNGHLDVVKYLLELGTIDPHLKTNMGKGLLDILIQNDISFFNQKYDIEQVLLKDISSTVNYQEHEASIYSDIGEMIKYLFTAKVLKFLNEDKKIQLMHWACMHCETELIKYLVADEECDPVSRVPHSNVTTLHRVFSLSTIRYLVEDACHHICFSDLCALLGRTPLHHAATYGNLDVLSYLVYCGCNPEAPDWEKNTPLHIAAMHGNIDALRFLVNVAKCSIASKNAINESPMEIVYSNSRLYIVEEMEECIATAKCMYMLSNKTENIEFDEDYNFLLHYACKVGQLDLVKHLASIGFCMKQEVFRGSLPLHQASYTGCLEAVEFLLEECNAQSECKDDFGNTPLHVASNSGQLSIVQYLIEYCNIVCENDSGNIPLHLACREGRKSVADLLASKVPQSVYYYNKDGNTPLHLACSLAHPAVVKLLIEKFKCQLDIPNNEGMTPVDLAFTSTQFELQWEIPRYLIQQKPAALQYLKKKDPVHWACAVGDLVSTKLFVNHSNFDTVNNQNDSTALHIACSGGHLDVIEYLVSIKADDLLFRNKEGYTPLDLALKHGHVEVVMFILNKFNITADYWNPDVSNPLHNCCLQESLDLLKLLTEMYHWDINNQDRKLRYTPLMLATELGCFDIFEYLVTVCQCDVSLTNKDGRSALHIASAEGYLDMVQFLVEQAGCKRYSEDCKFTPFLLACARGHLHIVDYFLKKKYDPHATWKDLTAIHIAAIGGHMHVIEYLDDNDYLNASTLTASGESALHLLKSNASAAAAAFLISKGCDPNQVDCDKFTPLQRASARGNIELVAYFVEKHNCIASTDSTVSKIKHSALYLATIFGHLPIVKYLVVVCHCQPDLNNDQFPMNAVQIAAIEGHEHVFAFLVKYAKPDEQCLTPEGETLLHLACSNLSLLVIKTLLQRFSFSLENTDSNGNNCLHKAASNKNSGYRIFKYLTVNCNLNPKLGNNNGATPLHIAVKNGNTKLVKYILDECYNDTVTPTGSEIENGSEQYYAAVNVANSNGYTPLHYACEQGHLGLVTYLVMECACDTGLLTKSGRTILHLAAMNGCLEVVKYLSLKCITFCDPNATDESGYTSVHLAGANGHLNILKYLLEECTCDTNVLTISGRTVLHLAIMNSHLEIVKYLITNHISDPNTRDTFGYTSVHLAGGKGHTQILQYLLNECDGDIYLRSNTLSSTLHLACQYGHLDTVIYLITELNNPVNIVDIENNTPLHLACQNGYLNIVKYLVEECTCDTSVLTKSGRTILHLAIMYGHFEIVKYLIINCISNSNARDKFGYTSVHLAGANGHTQILQYLLNECDGDIYLRSNTLLSTLHLACQNGHLDTVIYLISVLNHPVNIVNIENNTPLHLACQKGHLNIVKYLVEDCTCDTSALTKSGRTILHLAIMYGHFEIVKYLITNHISNSNARDKFGYTSVHLAGANGHTQILQYLLNECDGDIYLRSNTLLSTLHLACQNGHLDTVIYLISVLNHPVNIVNIENNTPLHLACQKGHLNIVKYLVEECTCDTSVLTKSGRTILHLAIMYGHFEIVKYLITNHISNSNARDKFGYTSVHLAGANGHTQILQYLLNECDGDIYLRSNTLLSTLHLACQNGHLDTVIYLISVLNHPVNIVNIENNTPLHLACQKGHLNIVKYLVEECTCDTSVLTKSGRTILHLAIMYGHFEIVKYLITNHISNSNARDKFGYISVHLAGANGHTQILQYLLNECDGDIYLRSNTLLSTLHLACQNGHLDTVIYLITELHLPVTMRDNFNNTPLHLACKSGHINILLSNIMLILASKIRMAIIVYI